MVSVLRRYRRKNVVEKPLNAREVRTLAGNLGFYSRLSDEQRVKLVKLTRVIVHEKYWEGCGGLALTDDMKLVIAAQAALLLIGMNIDPMSDAVFPNVKTVLVYPAGFVAPTARQEAGGVVTEGHANLGEAHYMGLAGGPIIVSWRDALAGGADADDGRNLVIHEFAHKLDFLDGVIDGTPPLSGGPEEYERWKRVMGAHYQDLVRRAQRGEPSVLNYYGATNPAEFFAVATEAYFERGAEMRRWLPELYEALRGYYRVEMIGE
jgi:Mlc titration factor MtfA (ptsG expression regulator)